jgi:hypothetical protein
MEHKDVRWAAIANLRPFIAYICNQVFIFPERSASSKKGSSITKDIIYKAVQRPPRIVEARRSCEFKVFDLTNASQSSQSIL